LIGPPAGGHAKQKDYRNCESHNATLQDR
jgi:hypothetical protein